MLKVLLKKQLSEIFRNYFYDAKKNKARSKAATAGYLILFVGLMVIVLGGIFAALSMALCSALAQIEMDWLYFAIMGMLAIFLGAFGSVFNTYTSLYLSKDNDLLLSMPIPVNTIMISRLLSVYLMGLMYSAVVIVPAIIVYWITVSATISAVLGSLLLMVLISIFVLTLSCALGWVVAKISLKIKHKSFITVIISLVFIGAYYFVYFKAQSLLSDLIANAALYGEKIKGAAYPLYLFGRVAIGDGIAIITITITVLLLFALMWLLISRSYLKIATSTGHSTKNVYKRNATKQKSATMALLQKESRRFLSSPNYILNCGLGTLLMPIGGIALLLKGPLLISTLNQLFSYQEGFIAMILSAVFCFATSINMVAAPSVSLEGKSLWLLQSLPVTPWQVLRAKLSLQLILTVTPAIFCLVCIMITAALSPLCFLLMAALLLSYIFFLALFQMLLGLKLPNLAWTNEVTPIKQSACVGISLLMAFVYPVVLCGLYFLIGYKIGFWIYTSAFLLITILLCIGLFIWLKKRGTALFAAL